MTGRPSKEQERDAHGDIGALQQLCRLLQEDARTGDLDRSHAALTLARPIVAKAAVLKLGLPYLDALENSAQASFGSLQGKAAVKDFVARVLQPALEHKAPPPKPRKGSLLRRVSRIALGLTLGLTVLSGGVKSQNAPHAEKIDFIAYTVPQQPALVDNNAATPQPQLQTARELEQDFARSRMGRELLQFMRQHSISFSYDSTMAAGNYAEYSPERSAITMRPTLGREDQVIYLAHELRHAWQDKVLDYWGWERKHLSPAQRFTLRRFLEADARAFSAFFEAERRRTLGGPEPDYGTAEPEKIMSGLLRQEFNSRNGLTLQEYRTIALEHTFGVLSNYNPRHFELMQLSVSNFGSRILAADDPGNGTDYAAIRGNLNALQAEFDHAPTDAEFFAYLRRFGGMSFSATAPTSLQDPAVTDDTLLNAYPRRVNDATLAATAVPAIDSTIRTLTEQYNGHRRRVAELQGENELKIAEAEQTQTPEAVPPVGPAGTLPKEQEMPKPSGPRPPGAS